MIKKTYPVIALLALLIPIAYAGEGDYGANRYNLGLYGYGESFPLPPTPEAGAEAGAGIFASQSSVSTVLYDLIVSIQKSSFLEEEIIKAKITVINKQGVPTKDAILHYYLLSPDKEIVGEAQEVFLPEEQSEFVFNREIKLPQNTKLGEWKFVVDFYPVEIEPIQALVSFEVASKMNIPDFAGFMSNNLLLCGMVLAVILFLSYEGYKGRQKNIGSRKKNFFNKEIDKLLFLDRREKK